MTFIVVVIALLALSGAQADQRSSPTAPGKAAVDAIQAELAALKGNMDALNGRRLLKAQARPSTDGGDLPTSSKAAVDAIQAELAALKGNMDALNGRRLLRQ